MTRLALHWLWSLGSQDLSAVIGLGLIALAVAVAVLRKIGDWS